MNKKGHNLKSNHNLDQTAEQDDVYLNGSEDRMLSNNDYLDFEILNPKLDDDPNHKHDIASVSSMAKHASKWKKRVVSAGGAKKND
jgi:hypothetical protein